MKLLGSFEYLILKSVSNLGRDAYGLKIYGYIYLRTHKEPAKGATYTVLQRLASKGYLESYNTEPTPSRGGRRKRVYKICSKGREALINFENAIEAMSKF